MEATQAAIKTTITTTTTTTQPTTTTTTQPTTTTTTQPTTTEAAKHFNTCVLASALSATCVILFFTICGILYYLYQRKKKKSSAEMARTPKDAPILPNKSGLKGQTRNPGFESEVDYSVPPKREAPLPRKKGGKKEELTISPYHGTLRSQEDYMVPPSRNDSFIEPPLPPNLARKLQKQNENDSLRPESSASSNSYYLDMEGIKDDLYQNVDASSDDDIYINN